METPETWATLATVAGGSVAALVVVQFVGEIVDLSAKAKRVLSAVVGLVAVTGATIVVDGADWRSLPLAVLVGMQAGLAASKTVETVRHGLAADVRRSRPENPHPPD